MNGKYAEFYLRRGTDWFTKGDYDKAIADYNDAVRLKPIYAVAYFDRGYMWAYKHEYAKAIADWNEALRPASTLAL